MLNLKYFTLSKYYRVDINVDIRLYSSITQVNKYYIVLDLLHRINLKENNYFISKSNFQNHMRGKPYQKHIPLMAYTNSQMITATWAFQRKWTLPRKTAVILFIIIIRIRPVQIWRKIMQFIPV